MAVKKNKNVLFTILDANINRTKEGLRVIEDVVRFIYNKKKFTKNIKDIRHNIDENIKKISPIYKEILKNRISEKDPGRYITTKEEIKKRDLNEILIANFKRVEESLRVLEEITKLIDTKISINIKELRYKVYELEKKIII